MKLIGKITIEGTIEAKTGLHIGGNKSSLEIGGVDLNVIKTGRGLPYIPGSSFKGKMRGLLAKVRGSNKVESDPDELKILFGDSGANDKPKTGANDKPEIGITRLFIRDAPLDTKAFEGTFGKENERVLDYKFSEVKTENTIFRSKGTAEHPRQIERIPAGSIFNFNMMLDIYDKDVKDDNLKLIYEAFTLLNLDYLGGHGSRGSGEVKIKIVSISEITISDITGISKVSVEDMKHVTEIFSDLM